MSDWHVLHFFDQQQPRKATVLRQIFSNKRTGSTLYWGLRYHYLDYLNAVPRIKTDMFNQVINDLVHQGLLEDLPEGMLLTTQGQSVIKSSQTKYSYASRPELNQRYDYQLWQAIMLLMIQVSSEYRYQNANYYVATTNLKAQFLIKKWLQRYGFETLATETETQLEAFLDQCDADQANLFAAKLIGHAQNGMSDQQIATQLGIDTLEVEITWKDLCLQFADFIDQEELEIGKLAQIAELSGTLTPTIRQTQTLFEQGKTVDQIIQIRRLRRSTIEEHLQIMAIFQPDFPYERVISTNDMETLDTFFEDHPNIDQWKYKQIQQLDPEMSFLKFRLYAIMKTHGESNE